MYQGAATLLLAIKPVVKISVLDSSPVRPVAKSIMFPPWLKSGDHRRAQVTVKFGVDAWLTAGFSSKASP